MWRDSHIFSFCTITDLSVPKHTYLQLSVPCIGYSRQVPLPTCILIFSCRCFQLETSLVFLGMGCNSSSVVANGRSNPGELIVVQFDKSDQLEESHCFSFESILKELKATPSLTVPSGIEYGLLHTGGFVRIATDVCRVYYMAQNTTEHTTPDWKFHVSVCFEDLPKAWNIIAKLFIDSGCRSGMKMCFCDISNHFGHWSQGQFGREITIYIYKHVKAYKSVIVDDPKLKLSRKLEHRPKFWTSLITAIEQTLTKNEIRSHGLAAGDYPINQYVSIRNEAFVKVGKELVYPPNEYGFNAAGHKCPYMKLKATLPAITVAAESIVLIDSAPMPTVAVMDVVTVLEPENEPKIEQ